MSFIPPLLEDDEDIQRRTAHVADQQRRLSEQLRIAEEAQQAAIAAMREARKLMSFPMSTSVSWAEKIDRDE